MDREYADIEKFYAKALCVSEERWLWYIEMMTDVGYIKGVQIERDIYGSKSYNVGDIQITLCSVEYFQENSIMQRMYKAMISKSSSKSVERFCPIQMIRQ